jgi:hypothetical protein
MVAKVRKISAVSKQTALKCNLERFKLRKLSDPEVRKQYQIKISNQSEALKNLLIART